ncbi:MAG: isocitrate/isopropylmalate dehydrogenase family protein [Betaproteobacteria bacterium]|nr:isocitrate/isopropylmalate dehydrogenase family protein [Betaproteobacteria bacterium]
MSIAVTLLPGDGIGPEIVRAARRVVDATGVRVDWEEMTAGELAYGRQGTPVPEEVLASARRSGLVLKGPLTNPGGTPYGSPTIMLRRRLGLFASVRCGRAGPGVPSRFPGMDLVIVREITEDVSAESSQAVGDQGGIAIRVITRPASLRVSRFAFDLARRLGRTCITVAHVATNFKTTDGLFLAAAREVAAAYPDIGLNDELLDAVCLHLMRNPARVDMLLTPNFYGNFLSGLIAGMAGSVGMQSGADYGEGVAMFEAGHGTLPRHAGKDLANPAGLILAAALLLDHAGETQAGQAIRNAVDCVTAAGRDVTYDLGGAAGTQAMADAIVASLGAEAGIKAA